jgi:hypothetical protein
MRLVASRLRRDDAAVGGAVRRQKHGRDHTTSRNTLFSSSAAEATVSGEFLAHR